MKGQYVNHPTIGKGKLTKGKTSAKGVKYDQIEGYILDPKTGDHIGLKMFVSSTPILNGVTKAPVIDKEGNPQFQVSIKFKGIRSAAKFAQTPMTTFTPTATKFTLEAKDTGATQGGNPDVNVSTIKVSDDEIIF